MQLAQNKGATLEAQDVLKFFHRTESFQGRQSITHNRAYDQPSDKEGCATFATAEEKIRAVWSTANAIVPSNRKMRLTSRDEGGGRGGGGKEEEGGVDELHLYLGLGG